MAVTWGEWNQQPAGAQQEGLETDETGDGSKHGRTKVEIPPLPPNRWPFTATHPCHPTITHDPSSRESPGPGIEVRSLGSWRPRAAIARTPSPDRTSCWMVLCSAPNDGANWCSQVLVRSHTVLKNHGVHPKFWGPAGSP